LEDVAEMAELVLPSEGQVLCCAISPADPNLVCTGNQADYAILFKLGAAGEEPEMAELRGHTDSVVSVSFSSDGQYVATASYDATIRVWNAADGSLVHVLSGPASEVEFMRWHPKGHALLGGSADCTAWLWWAPTGKVMQVLAGHADKVNAGCFPCAGKSIATGGQAGEVIIWNPRQGTAVHNLSVHQDAVLCLESHPSEPVVVTGAMDGTCAVVHVETGKTLATLSGHAHEVEAVSFFQGAMPLLATGGIDGSVRVWDSNTWNLRLAVPAHQDTGGGVTKLFWHPTEPVILSAGMDCMVRAHDARNGQQVRVLTASDDRTGRIFAL
jgi:WD40 repeat protein